MKSQKNKNNDKTTAKAGAVMAFFKKNVYIILMIVCILAIATMITVAAVLNSDGGKVDDPIINIPDKPDETKPPVEKPDDGEPTVKPWAFELSLPIANSQLGGHDFTYDKCEVVEFVNINVLRTHNGVDILAKEGADVLCALGGKVVSIATDSIEMTTVTLQHEQGYTTVYKLLENVDLKVGDVVSTGQKMGIVSSSKGHFEGDIESHLHFEALKDGVYINPVTYFLEGDK